MYFIEIIDNQLGEINNFNIFIGITLLLIITSIGVAYFISRKMGSDERSESILTKMGSISFIVYILLNSLIINTNVLHYKQFLTMNLSLSLIVASVYLIIRYRKDLK